MAAVDEDCELDRPRAAEIDQPVERGPDRSPGEQDVVDKDDRHAVDAKRDLRLVEDGLLVRQREIVTIEVDVEHPDGDARTLELLDLRGKPVREGHSARAD